MASKTGLPVALEARHSGTVGLAAENVQDEAVDCTELSTEERADLGRHEAVIERGMETFLDVGRALMAIRAGKLYRGTHSTFAEYLRERWSMSRSYAHRTISAAEVLENLLPIGNILPTNEAQARALTKLEPDQQREAWADAVGDAGGEQPTAKQVQNAAAKFIDSPVPTFATITDLRATINAWLNEQIGSYDRSGEIWKLAELLEDRPRARELRKRLEARIANGGMATYRDGDLTEAIQAEIQARKDAQEAERKAAPPPAPSAWDLGRKVEAFLAPRNLPVKAQHALLTDLRAQEDKHADWAELTATLPDHWRKRELKQALSNVADSLSYKFGADEWEAHQLPSGRWYARNKARNAHATPPFETREEALANTERATYGDLRTYEDLDTTLHSKGDGWQISNFIRQADADLLRELKIGLEARRAPLGAPASGREADPPPYIAERLALVDARVQAAAALVELVRAPLGAPAFGRALEPAPEQAAPVESPHPSDLPPGLPALPDDLTAAGFRLIQPKPNAYAIVCDEPKFESNWVMEADIDLAVEEARAALGVAAYDYFEQWLSAAPREPSLAECHAILDYAKRVAQRVRVLAPALDLQVTNVMPPLSQLINAVEKQVKR